MTIVDFLRLLRANLLVLVAATLIGGLLGWGYSALQPRLYASESTGFLAPQASEGGVIAGGLPTDQRASSYLALTNSAAVLERVAAETGQNVAGSLTATWCALSRAWPRCISRCSDMRPNWTRLRGRRTGHRRRL